jgi:GNAT superfamily N-acetyltransferase
LPAGHALPERDPERWHELLADPGVTMLVAAAEDHGGGLLGTTVCGDSRDADAGPEVGELRALFVCAGRWRGGVGRALMEAVLADLRERAFAQATVWSFAANERANRFYEAHGFRPDGSERTEEVWAHLPQLRYRRELA